MTQFSDCTFFEVEGQGLKGPTVRFEVWSATDTPIHPEAAVLMDRVLGPWEEPELGNEDADPPTGRAKQLLGWVYRCSKQAEWPVFQLGVFQAVGNSDLNGHYSLPTRIGPRLFPFRLFRFLVNQSLVENVGPNHWIEFERQLTQIQNQMTARGLQGVNRRLVLLELHKRNQPLLEIGQDIFQVGTGRSAQLVQGTVTNRNSLLLNKIQSDKVSSTRLFKAHSIPTVDHRRVHNENQALAAAEAIGYPVVLKPYNGTRGFGVICDIKTPEELRWAMGATEAKIENCLVEKFYVGDYARVTMLDTEFIEIRHVEFPRVQGDGHSTLRDLIDVYHNSPEETFIDGKPRTQKLVVDFDHAVESVHMLRVIEGQGYELDQVPALGESIRIGDRISSRGGGSLICWRRPEEIAPRYIQLFNDIQSLFGSAAIGIDVLCFDPENADQARINEVNFGPMINWYPELVSSFVDALLAQSPRSEDEHS